MALRPAAATLLQPPQRLPLWGGTFARFFPWVWAAILLLPATGYWMLFFGLSFDRTPLYIHIMQGVGLAMIAIFLHVFFAPYQRLTRAVAAQDWALAGQNLATIRKLVFINMLLGLFTISVAVAGPLLIV
jgi:uncharacterized membrane protein